MQKRLFLLLLALIILIPATGALTGLGVMSEQQMGHVEGRRKTAFGKDFPQWFTDNLGMRELFLKSYASVLLFVFGQSSNPAQVQVGQNGFLFLGDRHERTFSLHSGASRLSKNELLHLGEGFEAIIAQLRDKGIPVLIAVAPDKATIYGEYYPKWVKHVSRSFPQDNFNASPLLRDHVLFLENALLEYKKHSDPLYWKTDTHWNRMGAYLGYTILMEGLEKLTQKKLERMPLLGWKTTGPWRGDLERMNRVAPAEDVLRSLLLPRTEAGQIAQDKKESYSRYTNKKGLNPLNIAIVRDSFYNLIPDVYLKTFNTSYEIHISRLDKANLEAILAENPPVDLLIFLLVERSIPDVDRRLKGLAREFSAQPAS